MTTDDKLGHGWEPGYYERLKKERDARIFLQHERDELERVLADRTQRMNDLAARYVKVSADAAYYLDVINSLVADRGMVFESETGQFVKKDS